MWNWFKNLGLLGKVLVIGGILALVLFIASFVGGWSSGIKGWFYDKAYEERMAKVDALDAENKELRAKNLELDKRIVEAETKTQVLLETDKNLEAKAKAEVAKLDEALAAQDAEETRTAEDIDAYTRCIRVKQKMIDLGSKTARSIDCEKGK